MAPFVLYWQKRLLPIFWRIKGREGTTLQMAGSIADQFSKPFKLSVSDRTNLIIAAVAGGFLALYLGHHLPEQFCDRVFLIGRIRYNALFPAFITAIIADIVTKLWQTPHTHYHINSIPDISFINIAYALLCRSVFGLCASTLVK